MSPSREAAHWEALQARAHLPEAQEEIRREIRRGVIRVVPAAGGGIRIIPQPEGPPAVEAMPPTGRDPA
jgi:hypothetical protein